MKQKRGFQIITWLLCVAMVFQTTGITAFASEVSTQEEIVLMEEETVGEEVVSTEETMTEELSATVEETMITLEETSVEVEETTLPEEITVETETVQEEVADEIESVPSLIQTTQSEATTFEVDSLYYEVLSETDKTVVVTGCDRAAYSGMGGYPFDDIEIVVPSTVTYNGTTYQVTEIGEFAFADYTYDLEYGNPFQGYDEYVSNIYVQKITVSEGVKKIGGGAFYRINQLKEVVLPDSVEEIGNAAFTLDSFRFEMAISEEDTLLEVNIPKNVKSIGAYAYSGVTFNGTLVLPDGLETIGEYAFGWNNTFDNYAVVDVPASVTTIGKNAFCTSSLVKAVLRKTIMPTVSQFDADNVYSALMFGNQYLSNLVVYVPADLMDGYGNSPLSNYVTGIQFLDLADYQPEESITTETFRFEGENGVLTQIDIELTRTAFVKVVIGNDQYTFEDIIWELTLLDGLDSTSTDPADFIEFIDNKNGYLMLKAKKAGYLRLTGKITGYANVTLDISNLYVTDEGSRAFIARLDALTAEERAPLSVVQERMGTTEQMAEIRAKAEEIVKDCTTDQEKIFAIEQWLASHVAYDYDYLKYHADSVTPIKSTPYSAYEVYCNRFSVCGGYTNLAEAMLRSLGIPCVQIFGLANDIPDEKAADHAWNAAYDADAGRWIHFDATWDSRASLYGSDFSCGKTSMTWFDFDIEAGCDTRYISSSTLDWEDYTVLNKVECNYITLYVGETQKLEFADGVEYNSLVAKGDYLEWEFDFGAQEKIKREDTFITVDTEGNVTGVKEGMGIVEIDDYYKVYVRVLEKSEPVFSKDTYIVAMGDSTCVEILSKETPITGLMEFTSSDTGVVTVDDKGVLTPVAVGEATITACLFCNDLETISCKVVVVEEAMADTFVTEFEQDNFIYEVLTEPEGDVPGTVSVIGETFAYFESNNAITVTIPETVSYGEKTYTVTRIGRSAFSGLVGNATVNIPASVQRIEKDAFYCSRMDVGAELTGELIFPENSQLEYIGFYAFADNPKLTKVDLSNCTKLETIGDYAFSSCSYVSADLEMTGITQVILPNNLKEIGEGAFYLSQTLTTVNIPSELEHIGNYAFAYTDLNGIMDLSGVIEIGDSIFAGVNYLEGVILNDSWTAIPDKMFYGIPIQWVVSQSRLEESGGVETIESGSLLLSDKISHIGESAFESCHLLKKVQAPGVVSVGKRAFCHCTGIESFDFEQNLTILPEKAFMNCNALTEFSLHPEVTGIGYGAMYGLDKISDLRIESEKIGIFGNRCFSKGTNLYIPLSVSERYMKALKSCAAKFYDLDGNLLETVIKNVEAYLVAYPIYEEEDSYEVIREAIRFYVEYNDNTFEDITDFKIEAGTFKEGRNEITVTCGNCTDTIVVGESENEKPVAYLDIDFVDYVAPTFKVGESYQKIKNYMTVSVLDENREAQVVENYDVEPGYFKEGENPVTISFCDFVGEMYNYTVWHFYATEDGTIEPEDPVNPPEEPSTDDIIKGLHVEYVPGGALEAPKAGHIVSAQDLKVSHLVKTSNGMEYRETSDYTITGGELKRGDNTVIISSFDSEGNVITYEMFLYAEAKLDAFDVKLKDGVKLKAGDIIDTSMFIGTASYVGENSYTDQREVEYFSLDGDMVVQEGKNTFTFSYTEYTLAYGEITKYATWEMCTDDKPVLSTSTLNINQYAVTPVSFEVYVPFGMTPQLDGVFYQNNNGKVQSGISYTTDEDGACTVQIPTVMKNKTYKLYIKVTVKETENVYYLPIKLTLKTTLPKITASAEAMNLFFTDEENRTSTITLKNPSAEVIRSVVFEENSSMDKYFDVIFDREKQTLALKLTDPDVTKKTLVSKGKILVYTENYNKPVAVSVKISVSDKQPKLKVTPSSVTINTRLYDQKETSFEVTMQEGKVYVPVTLNGAAPELVTCADLIDQISTEDNKVTISLKNTADFKKLKTVKVKVQAANWKKPVQISHKIKTVDVLPKAVLTSKTLMLDMRAVGAQAATMLRFDTKPGDINYKDLPNTLTAVKNDATAPTVTLEKNTDGTYTVKAAYAAAMTKGTYKYEIMPELSDGTKLKKVTLSVKVTTAAKVANASLKAQKGSKIDLISRTSTKYVYTVSPTVKGTYIKNVVLKKAEIGNAAVPTTLFDVKINEQNGVVSTIEVSASEEGEFLSGKKYKLTFEITPATDAQELNVAEVKVTVTLKESTLKLNTNMNTAVLYRNIPYVKAVYKVTPKTADIEIGKMEYVPSTGVPEGAFEIVQTNTGTYQIRIADKAKVKSGKSYKLNFKVQAEGGTKTVTQKLTIKVQ